MSVNVSSSPSDVVLFNNMLSMGFGRADHDPSVIGKSAQIISHP